MNLTPGQQSALPGDSPVCVLSCRGYTCEHENAQLFTSPRDLNSGRHACAASALALETSLSLLEICSNIFF